MRKTLSGLMAALFMLIGFAGTAAAETNTTEASEAVQEQASSPVECTFLLFTQHTVPDEYAFRVGDTIDLGISLTDPERQVANIVFSAGLDQKGGKISEGMGLTVPWFASAAGQWNIGAQLFDAAGQEIIPTGDCDGVVTVLEASSEPAHPETPDVEEPPPASEPEPQPDPVDNTCKDDDPSTLVQKPNADGTVSWYTPDGVHCADILPKPTVVQSGPTAGQHSAQFHSANQPTLPHTGLKDSLPLYGAAFLACGLLFTLAGKKHAARVAAK